VRCDEPGVFDGGGGFRQGARGFVVSASEERVSEAERGLALLRQPPGCTRLRPEKKDPPQSQGSAATVVHSWRPGTRVLGFSLQFTFTSIISRLCLVVNSGCFQILLSRLFIVDDVGVAGHSVLGQATSVLYVYYISLNGCSDAVKAINLVGDIQSILRSGRHEPPQSPPISPFVRYLTYNAEGACIQIRSMKVRW
jgi:hypothetical protein